MRGVNRNAPAKGCPWNRNPAIPPPKNPPSACDAYTTLFECVVDFIADESELSSLLNCSAPRVITPNARRSILKQAVETSAQDKEADRDVFGIGYPLYVAKAAPPPNPVTAEAVTRAAK
mmetsp:Transcript_7014/g.10229  ORF Transcript_7014/g.10229 Transcript_7014/m.10229 type:complete len:119 (+) Transcript_7014:133-489(+)